MRIAKRRHLLPRRSERLLSGFLGMGALLSVLLCPVSSDAADVVEYYALDAIGNVRLITDANGAIIERHDYYPFGEECTTGPCASNPGVGAGQARKFTGKERDTETGFDYFGARYYGSKLGRFTTVDPVFNWNGNLVKPQRWNRYASALNNPLRNVDPDGRDTIDLGIGFAQGIGNVAVGIVTAPVALVTNPGNVAGGIAQNFRLLGHGLANPAEVIDTYLTLATSANDADQRALGAAFGEGSAVAALTLAPFAKSTPHIGEPYRRPSGATTLEQRAAVQGQSCVDCGTAAPRMFADHKRPLVREYYETGKINETRMRAVRSVQPQCPTCSARQGAELSRYSAAKKKELSP